MRFRSVLATLLISTIAAAQPGADLPPPPEPEPLPPEPVAPEPPPAPEPAPAPAPEQAPAPGPTSLPPGSVPPITINITNNNNGNNSNTNTQTNAQDNTQTNTQTTTAPVTVSTPVTTTVTTSSPSAIAMPDHGPPRGLVGRYELVRTRPRDNRWITLGVTSDLHRPGPSGARGTIDLLGRGAFTLGVAASIESSGEGGHHGGGRGDHRGGGGAGAVGYVAWTGKIIGLDLRAQVGLGVGLGGGGGHGRGHGDRDEDSAIARTTTDETDELPDDREGGREGHGRIAPRAEASVVVGLPIGKHLGILAGPVVSATKNDGVDASVLAGLRYRF